MTKTVGQRIEELAAAKGLPAGAALAALFGVRYETLRKWRIGEVAPNRARQDKIGKVLGVAPEAFMHGVEAGELADYRLQRLLENYRAVSLERQRIIYAVAENLNGPGADALLRFFEMMSRVPLPKEQPALDPETPAG